MAKKRLHIIPLLFLLFLSARPAAGQVSSEVSSKGTDFWLASTYPFYSNDSFLVAVSSSKPTTAYMEIPGFGITDSIKLGYNDIKYFVIPAAIRRSYYYYYVWNTTNFGKGKNAIHITSKLPVKVYAFSTGTYYSSGATAVYPSVTQPPNGEYFPYKSRYQWNFNSTRYRIYFFSVVGIDDSVTVKLNVANGGGTVINNRPPGDTLKLYRGEIVRFYMWSLNQTTEPKLTVQGKDGKRIAVFSENFYDFEDNNCSAFDLMYEQMLPENLLGKSFVLSPIVFLKKGYRFSVSAVDDSTKVYKDGTLIASLNKTEQYYGKVGGDSSVLITSNNPINCWEKIDLDTCTTSGGWWRQNGGISLFTVNGTEQLVTDANVLIPTTTSYPSNFINVIVPKIGRDSLYIDGQLILSSQMNSIINGNYYLFRDSVPQGNLRIINRYGFYAYAYGRGIYGGYAYNASSGLASLKRIILTESFRDCDTGYLVDATSEGVPASDYRWTWNNIELDTGLSTVFYAPKPGVYQLQLSYIPLGGSVRDSVYVEVIVKASSRYDFIKERDVKICKNDYTVQLPYSKTISYKWNDGDTSRVKKINNSGLYTIAVKNSKTECQYKDTLKIEFFDTIKAKFNVQQISQCPGIPIYLNNKSVYGSGDSIVRYQWKVDGLQAGRTKNDTVPYAYPGNYTFKLIIENRAGCIDSTTGTTYISAIPTLIAGTRVLDSCVGTSEVRFNSQSRLSEGKIVGYRWIFSDGDTTHDWRQTIRTFNKAGTVAYNFAAYTEQGCGDTTATKYVEIYKGPNPKFTIPDSSVCLSGNYFAINNTTANKDSSRRYLWYWGNGAGSAETDPGFVSYSDTGLYTIRMVGLDSVTLCGGDTLDRPVRVLQSPKAAVITDSFNYCENKNFYKMTDVSVSGSSSFKQSIWKWPDGSTDTTTGEIYKSFDTTGVFRFTLFHSIGKGCVDSVKKNLVVYPSPFASFKLTDSSYCAPKAYVQTLNTSKVPPGAVNYTWFVNGGVQSGKDIGKTLLADTGLTTLRLSAFHPLYGCSDTFSKTYRVYPSPNPKISASDTAKCFPGELFTLNDSTSTQFPEIPKRYWLINGDTTGVFPLQYSLDNKGTQIIKLVYELAGICKDTAEQKLEVLHPNDSLSLSADMQIACAPAKINFNVNPSNNDPWLYIWNTQGQTFQASAPHTQEYLVAGKQKVYIEGIIGNCKLADSMEINIVPKPILNITSLLAAQQCFKYHNFEIEANATNAVAPLNYTWNVPGNTFGNRSIVNPKFASPGIFKATVFLSDSNSCKDTASIDLELFESPTISLTNDSACLGTSKTKVAGISPSGFGVKKYTWLLNGGLVGNNATYTHTYNTLNADDISLIVEGGNGCIDTSNTANLRGLETPKASFKAIVLNSKPSGVPVSFTNTSSGYVRSSWTFESGASDTSTNVVYNFSQLGNKNILLQVWNSAGCSDTAQMQLFVSSEEIGYVPTAFSPNQNNLNETFKPAALSAVKTYEMLIFNRWGQMVFKTNDPNEGWDGMVQNKPAPEGVYGFQVYAEFLTGKGFLNQGSVHLIR